MTHTSRTRRLLVWGGMTAPFLALLFFAGPAPLSKVKVAGRAGAPTSPAVPPGPVGKWYLLANGSRYPCGRTWA